MDRAYFLGPDKGGERAYGLLGEALKKTGQGGGRPVGGARQAVPHHGPAAGAGLVMEQLRYADEVRSIAEVPIRRSR